jgi:threonine synthase
MQYVSTRGAGPVSAAEAILMGLAPDGGLWTPAHLPWISEDRLAGLFQLPYHQLAYAVLHPFLEKFDRLEALLEETYSPGRFEICGPAPVSRLDQNTYLLELYHGPTLAFKDLALQLLPRLMVESARITSEERGVLVLAATSGDTGKAALEGFADVPGTRVAVLYPNEGVSPAQRRQMVTQPGENVWVYALEGNFDDAQRQVKALQGDGPFLAALSEAKWRVSSANSMNIGRLLPQIVYYFYAYGRLVEEGLLALGEKVDFVVPTGNFGDILAGWYARAMGLPVGELVCASNANRVLTDFFRQGGYDVRRPFHKTLSPSMDILVSSNLERLLFEAAGRDAGRVTGWMQALARDGCYTLPGWQTALEGFWAGCADDAMTCQAIADTYKQGRLVDPHTAVALHVLTQYRCATPRRRPAVVLATASPYKFSATVLEAIGQATDGRDGRQTILDLEAASGMPAPEAILRVWDMPELHTQRGGATAMRSSLLEFVRSKR